MSRPSSTRLQLFLTHLFAILASLGGLAFFLALNLPARYTGEVARHLRAETTLLRPLLEERWRAGPPADLEPLVRQLGADSGVRITVIDRSGGVLADTELDPGLLENHASRPEFQQAVATGRGQAVRYSRTLGIDMLYAAEPLAGGQAVLRLAAPLRQLEAVRRAIRTLLLVSVLAAGGLALGIATLLVRRLAAPLAALQDRVDRLAQGDLGARVRPEGSAELQRVGTAFNSMAGRLEELLRREAEDRSRYETILLRMADGIVVTDLSGRVQMFNPSAGRLLDASPAEVIGRTLLEGTLHSGLWELLERSLRGGTAETGEIRFPGTAGRILRVHAAPIVGEGERLAGGVLVLQDLTEARRLEEMRRQFVANVSHELKSPVAAMRALAETLVLRGQDRPELARDYAERLAAEAERMSRLLADLLDLTAIESGRREWRRGEVPVAPLVGGILERFREPAGARQTELVENASPELRAWADPGAVEQTLANLVDNAIRYSPPGARVSVAASARGEELLFTVTDTGPGIPPEALPRVFERFFRVDSGRARSDGGTGLGLAIAKHLVESQGGRIWVESPSGGGSRFSFTIPAAAPE
jgi:two-component system phosphate regulon sensor histidine kinase PhoR